MKMITEDRKCLNTSSVKEPQSIFNMVQGRGVSRRTKADIRNNAPIQSSFLVFLCILHLPLSVTKCSLLQPFSNYLRVQNIVCLRYLRNSFGDYKETSSPACQTDNQSDWRVCLNFWLLICGNKLAYFRFRSALDFLVQLNCFIP